MKENPKCAHEPRSCTARASSAYCCDECERQSREEPTACRCGHHGCTAEPLPIEAAEGLRLATEALAGT